MGIDNLETISGNTDGPSDDKEERPSDLDRAALHEAELQAEREEHQRRTAGTSTSRDDDRYKSTGHHVD